MLCLPTTISLTPPERKVFKPKEGLTVSQWAERHRYVSTGPATGLWRNELTPYLREPMDAFNQPHIREIVLCFAPQTGKTQVAFNCLAWAADQDPGPALYVMPDEKTARRISRRRIRPLFQNSPRLAALLGEKQEDLSTLAITLTNGMDVMLAWATSAAELASESIRYLFNDEVDKYPQFTGRETDPVSLARIRTNAYPHTKKVLHFSTPTDPDGYIWNLLNDECDQVSDYFVPCPYCGDWQKMTHDQVWWPKGQKDPRTVLRERSARYLCRACGIKWDDLARDRAVRAGAWQPRILVSRPRVVGFHLPSWYSPFVSLSEVAAATIRSRESQEKGMFLFTQHKAEPYEERIESKDEDKVLENRCELPQGIVASPAVALTMGVDVQKHGFWFVVRAWAKDLTSWLVQYGYVSTFADLETLAYSTRYQVEGKEGRTLGIFRAAVDTGGGQTDDDEWSRTEEIYFWLRDQAARGVFYGVKGASRPQLKRVVPRVIDKMARGNRPIPGGLELRIIDASQFKSLVHWRLARGIKEPQRMFLHSETGVDYARQLLAEELIRNKKGKTEWKRIRRDNHLLDCEVYAAAAADPEWTPSITLLAKMQDEGSSPAGQGSGTPIQGGAGKDADTRRRPDWFNRRK